MKSNRNIGVLVAATIAMGAAPASSQVIYEDLKLWAVDGAEPDYFGHSIAIDNGVVAVGASNDADNGNGSGSAYLFDASTGAQIAKLLPNDGAAGDRFGNSIALDNGIVAVGSPFNDSDGDDFGTAYLFDASSGAQIAQLRSGTGYWFGYSIDIDRGIVAVGAIFDGVSGAAYLFDASTGDRIAKLEADDHAPQDEFGHSIALGDGLVVVGNPLDDDNGYQSGSAYVFDASTGEQLVKLLAEDGESWDHFGISVAIDGGVVVVGAYRAARGGTGYGAAYLFDATTGIQLARLLPTDGFYHEMFGRAVSIEGGVAAVGSPDHRDASGAGHGAVFLYDVSTGAQIAKLLPSDRAGVATWFGGDVTIGHGVVAVGMPLGDGVVPGAGAAYLFDLARCAVDLTGDGTVNTRDFLAFLNAWATGDPIADWNGDGTVNTQDFIAYLNDWAEGCP